MVQALKAADPREIAGYQLLGRLGQGRLGEVFLARSRGGRLVALRVVAPELGADQRFRDRFRETVTAVREVSGFYVAQVVDAATVGNPLWLAGAYIPGPSLAEAVATHGPLPYEAVGVLGVGLTEALEAIHAVGHLHRDLTPGNVILAGDGPRVTDFALAHAWDDAHPSRTVAAVPSSFLAPEQVRSGVTGPASDVFALGGLLVFAATGNPPFGRDGGSAALHRIVAEDPDLSGVPAPLRELAGACLAKDPAERPSLQEIRRRLTGTGLTGPWLPPSLAGMVVERQEDADARNRPRPSRRALLTLAGAGTAAAVAVPLGLWLRPGGDHASGRRDSGGAGGRTAEVKLTPVRTMGVGAQSDVFAVSFSPDNAFLASGTEQGQINVFRDPGGLGADAVRNVAPAKKSPIGSVAFGHGNLLAASYMLPLDVSAGDFTADRIGVSVWQVTPSTTIANFKDVVSVVSGDEGTTLSPGNAVALSPDGRLVALGRSGKDCIGKVQVWEVGSGKRVATLVVRAGTVRKASTSVMSLAFSPDGRVLAAGYGMDKAGVQLWDTASFTPTATLALDSTETYGVVCLAFSADGRTLVGTYGGIAVWDMGSHRLTATLGSTASGYQSVALGPDGTTLATAAGGGVELWDLSTRKQLASAVAGRSGAGEVAFSPDGKMLAATTKTTDLLGAVQVWKVG